MSVTEREGESHAIGARGLSPQAVSGNGGDEDTGRRPLMHGPEGTEQSLIKYIQLKLNCTSVLLEGFYAGNKLVTEQFMPSLMFI